MKTLRFRHASLLLALALASATQAGPSPGYVEFGDFSAESEGRKFVEVNVGPSLIKLALTVAQRHEPALAEALQGLEQIRVNVIGLHQENAREIGLRMQKVRAELDAKGWDRIVTVREKKQQVTVHVKYRGQDAVEGLVVTVMEEGKEAVFVNVVGELNPEKLSMIGARFDIDALKKAGKAIEKK
jgi:Domain of unknown function (DUF4252)